MAQYNNFQPQVEEPSVFKQYFGSPLKSQWTLQKASMMMTILSNNMWKQAMEGQGIKWSGVVGFRGLALGSEGTKHTMGLARALSPHNLISRSIGNKTLEQSGFFGKGGILNKEGTNAASNFIGRLLGGGTIEASKFEKTEVLKKRLRQDILNKVDTRPVYDDDRLRQNIMKTIGIDKSKVPTIDSDIVKSNIRTKKVVRNISKAGRVVTWLAAAKIAYDIGSAAVSFGLNTAGNIVDRLEDKIRSRNLRNMEFGGRVGVGFYASRSGTERQRALSAVGSYGGGAAFGHEAEYQHVASNF